jgi:flagellar motor switch protein FliG
MSTSSAPLTGLEKTVIVLLSLGPAISGEILKRLPEDEVDAISSTMARLHTVTQQQVESVLLEYQAAVASQAFDVRGGLESARQMLEQAYGRDQATRFIDRAAKSLDQDSTNFASLQRADPQQLAALIQDEHPQTIALVLAHLDSSQAAALLSALPASMRTDIATRTAALDQIPPEGVRTIAAVIGQKFKNLGQLNRESCGGVQTVADILNRLDANNCSQILDSIEKEDPALFQGIRRLMFVFEDLKALDSAGTKELLGRVDRKILITALKGSSEELQRQIMSGMSQRGADLLREDMAALGPVKMKDVEAARQLIIAQARQLEKDGIISLKNSPSEQYVD